MSASNVSTTMKPPSRWQRFVSSDLLYAFRRSPVAMVAAFMALACVICALFAQQLAPHNPLDLASLNLMDALQPPAWQEGGSSKFLLGTDGQGRDILSALFYGARISLFVGLSAVALSVVIGVTLGLMAGFLGGKVDAFIMRVCDVMLSFPSILVALLIDGVGKAVFKDASDSLAFGVLIF
ncbi:MAG: ABC transporter permease, partial [Inhella sp.]